MKPVMNLDKVEFDDVEENGVYTSSRGQISDHIGARKLGYNLTVVPPGKVQCPFHCHHGEEEMTCLDALIGEASDAISGARPGARRETLEIYVKRLTALEEIAKRKVVDRHTDWCRDHPQLVLD